MTLPHEATAPPMSCTKATLMRAGGIRIVVVCLVHQHASTVHPVSAHCPHAAHSHPANVNHGAIGLYSYSSIAVRRQFSDLYRARLQTIRLAMQTPQGCEAEMNTLRSEKQRTELPIRWRLYTQSFALASTRN